MPLPDSTTDKQSTPLRQVVVAPYGATFRDGGILDFGRDHVFLNEQTRCEIFLPQSLVTFIGEQAVKEYLKGSEQHAGAHIGAGRNPDAGHGQARAEEGEAGAAANG